MESTGKKFAISFFYKSASAYSFLRQKGAILPAPSSIRKWIALNDEFKTGIDENVKQHLIMKFAAFTKKRRGGGGRNVYLILMR